jgi:uncharacterized RDD family membrane protein YckC
MPGWAPVQAPLRFEYAGFWRRVGATLIDGLVLSPLVVPLMLPLMQRMTDQLDRALQQGTRIDSMSFMTGLAGWSLAIAAVQYLYQALMIGAWGATVGKFAVGVRVRKADGSTATWREAFLRPLLQLALASVSTLAPIGILGLVDYLWMLWDAQKQTLHDKVAGTIVVRV